MGTCASWLFSTLLLASQGTAPSAKLAAAYPSTARVSNRKANVNGEIFILQYHGFVRSERRYDRSYANFRRDLERVYKLGMRTVTMTEYVENKMRIAPGATPVVLTFDDSNPSQFRFLSNGSIDPNCAVGIWQEFAQKHPDFPIKGTFYVVPTMMFGQKRKVDQKIKMLQSWGSEIGNHTMTHPNLGKLSHSDAERQIGGVMKYLDQKGIRDNVHFCIPYGIFPKDHSLVRQVTYGGKTYKMASNVLCGANPAPAPTSKKFNKYRIPRILSNEEEDGIEHWLAKAEKGKVNLYVQP